MWAIRSNGLFYSQGANPRWYGLVDLATHFEDEQAAHDEARWVLGLEPTDYVLDPCYPQTPRLPDGRRFRLAPSAAEPYPFDPERSPAGSRRHRLTQQRRQRT